MNGACYIFASEFYSRFVSKFTSWLRKSAFIAAHRIIFRIMIGNISKFTCKLRGYYANQPDKIILA